MILVDLDSFWRNRCAWPAPTCFSTRVASTESRDDPICAAMPQISWRGGELGGDVQIVPHKSAETTLVVAGGRLPFQDARNYYRGALVQFDGNERRKIVGSRLLPSGQLELTLSGAPPGAGSLGVALIDPSDFSLSETRAEIFVPCGTPLAHFYTGMWLHNETTGDVRRITAYNNFVAHVETEATGAPRLEPSHFYSIRAQLPLATCSPQPWNSTLTRIHLAGVTANPCGHFLRNSAPANSTIVPQIVAWDSELQIATVSPPFKMVPPLASALEILPITAYNSRPIVNTRFVTNERSTFQVQLLSLNIPQSSNIQAYPFVYVSLSSLHSTTGKNLLVSNNPHATCAQFRASLVCANKTHLFCKYSGDSSVQQLQIDTNDTIEFRLVLPDGKPLLFDEPEFYSPAAPNPLTQVCAYFSLTPHKVL